MLIINKPVTLLQIFPKYTINSIEISKSIIGNIFAKESPLQKPKQL